MNIEKAKKIAQQITIHLGSGVHYEAITDIIMKEYNPIKEPKNIFTIEEIKAYLIGHRLMKMVKQEWQEVPNSNDSLNNAITELEDFQDGIEAVSERLESKP